MKANARIISALFAVSGFLMVLLALPPARVAGRVAPLPATLTVHSNADAGGSCPGPSCTLRQAITAAMPGDTIDFDPSVTNITLASELAIDKSLTIAGPGASVLTISGNNSTRMFNIGSIYNAGTGTVTITNSTISGNVVKGGNGSGTAVSLGGSSSGGGIANNNGTINLINSTLAGNSATNGDTVLSSSGSLTTVFNPGSFGGGLSNLSGVVNISNSTVSGNAANGGLYSLGSGVQAIALGDLGGGVSNNGGIVRSTNSTFSGNSANGITTGGGIVTPLPSFG